MFLKLKEPVFNTSRTTEKTASDLLTRQKTNPILLQVTALFCINSYQLRPLVKAFFLNPILCASSRWLQLIVLRIQVKEYHSLFFRVCLTVTSWALIWPTVRSSFSTSFAPCPSDRTFKRHWGLPLPEQLANRWLATLNQRRGFYVSWWHLTLV